MSSAIISLPLRLWLLLLVMLVEPGAHCHYHSDTYVSTSVDQAVLLAYAVNTETVQGISSFRCVAHAVLRQWPVFACHTLDDAQTCTLGDIKDPNITILANTRSPTLTNCKMTIRFEVAPCSSPFTYTKIGCIYVDVTLRNFDDARTACRGMGSDIFSANSLEDSNILQQYLQLYDAGTIDLWIGLVRMNAAGDDWMWVGNGRHPGPDLSLELVSQSNLNNEWCSRMDLLINYGLNDMTCNTMYGVLCQL